MAWVEVRELGGKASSCLSDTFVAQLRSTQTAVAQPLHIPSTGDSHRDAQERSF